MSPVRVRLLAMCRSERSPVIARLLLSLCEVGGSGNEESKKCPPLSPAVLWFVNDCEKTPDRKKIVVEKLFPNSFLKIKIEHISGSIV